MTTAAISRNLNIPIGVHAETLEPLTVMQALQNGIPLNTPDTLSHPQQVAFVADAWRKGLWSGDIMIDASEPINMEQAINEIEAGSETGTLLLTRALRALEMLREHVAEARGDDQEETL